MGSWINDFKYGIRTLAHRPVLTAVAILSIALGVGANGAVFSLVNGLLLRPPKGVAAPDELTRIYQLHRNFDFPMGLPVADFREAREAAADLTVSMTGHAFDFFALSIDGAPPRPVAGAVVVGDYFATLGTRPSTGRLFGDREEEAREPVVVVAHDFWRDHLGADPDVVGRSLLIDGQAFTVIGVAEPGFHGNEILFELQLWMPAPSIERVASSMAGGDPEALPLRVTARLLPGVTVAQLDERLVALSETLARDQPAREGSTFHAMPDADARIEAGLGGPMKLIASVMLLLVALVLLIACANVANLLLARAAGRRRELALRVAVGASRAALVRQLLAESLLLAAGGGVLGVLVAIATGNVLSRFQPPGQIPIRLDVTPDARVYVYTAVMALLAGLAFGLLPALRASRTDPIEGLKVSLVGTGGARRLRSSGALVVAQVALSLVLLVGGGLFLRSLNAAQAVDIGFDATNLVSATLDLSKSPREEADGRVFFAELERSVAEIAGVEAVTYASWMPMDWYSDGLNLGIGRDLGEDLGDEMITLGSWVGPDYFEMMKTRIVEGRAFDASDDERARGVIIVNQAFVDHVWPGESAVGKTLRLGGREGEPVEVVGVAATGKYRLIGESPRPYFFGPLEQQYRGAATLLVRSDRPPGPLLEEIVDRIARLDPTLAVQNAGPVESSVQTRALAPIQLVAGLAGGFGLIGLLLASTGLYAVIAFSVAQRMREIGVRMALGARAAQVMNAILGEGLRLAVVGVAIGLAASFAVTRLMGSFLVGVSSVDPVTFVSVVAILVVVAAVASLVPALRAARVDPARTLRAD